MSVYIHLGVLVQALWSSIYICMYVYISVLGTCIVAFVCTLKDSSRELFTSYCVVESGDQIYVIGSVNKPMLSHLANPKGANLHPIVIIILNFI